MLVKDVLAVKGAKVWSITTERTLKEALTILIENKIGVVLVFDRAVQIAGILSERDIMRECHHNPKGWDEALVKDLMTPCVITVGPETDLEEVTQLMTDNRIRHIPVMKGDDLAGIVSIGDVVKARLKSSEHEMQHIKDYMASS